MFTLELVEPGQQQIAAKIRRGRKLQHATDLILTAGQQAPAFIQVAQGRPGVFEKALALRGEPQAAGGTGQQPCAQVFLDALEGSTGHRRRKVHDPGRRRQAAQVCGTHEQLQVIESQHEAFLDYQKNIERACSFSRFYPREK